MNENVKIAELVKTLTIEANQEKFKIEIYMNYDLNIDHPTYHSEMMQYHKEYKVYQNIKRIDDFDDMKKLIEESIQFIKKKSEKDTPNTKLNHNIQDQN
jgi:hypothetical protein